VDGPDLVLTDPQPLPSELLDKVRAHKPAILAALAHPLPPAVATPQAGAYRKRSPRPTKPPISEKPSRSRPGSWSTTPAYRGPRPSLRPRGSPHKEGFEVLDLKGHDLSDADPTRGPCTRSWTRGPCAMWVPLNSDPAGLGRPGLTGC
jgi:hypothetical protein